LAAAGQRCNGVCCHSLTGNDARLWNVVEAWSTFSEEIKRVISSLCSSSQALKIEPASESIATNSTAIDCENQQSLSTTLTLHDGDVNCPNLATIDADLRLVVLAWELLPPTFKHAIRTLVASERN